MAGSVGHVQFKTLTSKINFATPFCVWGSAFTFLTLSLQDLLVLIQSTSEGRMVGLTLEPPNCFQPRTPGLRIQHLNHQTTARLDLPISFLYMSKHCSISVIYTQNPTFCTIHFSFAQLYQMPFLFSNNEAKQKPIRKQHLWLFDTFSTKKIQPSSVVLFNQYLSTLVLLFRI